jgi:hypothetical protein
MTDNEKAATFIGWRPCVWIANSAPDMSDPRNYMKALEAIEASDGGMWDRTSVRRWYFIRSSNGKGGMGKTAVQALAALYDAEHPTGSTE